MRLRYKVLIWIIAVTNLLIIFVLLHDQICSGLSTLNNQLKNQILISLLIGGLISSLFTLFLITLFRPKLSIQSVSLADISKKSTSDENSDSENQKIIKVNVFNKRYCSNAINIKIELAFINDLDKTFSLEADKYDFLMLPSRMSRTFQAHDIEKYTKVISVYSDMQALLRYYENKNIKFRIRIHSEHSFTGFGKSFEEVFILQNGVFVKENYRLLPIYNK